MTTKTVEVEVDEFVQRMTGAVVGGLASQFGAQSVRRAMMTLVENEAFWRATAMFTDKPGVLRDMGMEIIAKSQPEARRAGFQVISGGDEKDDE